MGAIAVVLHVASQLRRAFGSERERFAGAHHFKDRRPHTERNVTNAETGLPGNPKIAHLPARPKRNGLPGLIATRQRSICAPTHASSGLTRSRSPTETPPLITSTSCFRPARSAAFE